jgi:hypothetical protein
MMKVYDIVELDYLHGCLSKLDFHTTWIQSVMRCVTCVRYVVRVNGEIMTPVVHLGVFGKEIQSVHICFSCSVRVCHVYCNKRRAEVSSMVFAMVDSVPLSPIYCLPMPSSSLRGAIVGVWIL